MKARKETAETIRVASTENILVFKSRVLEGLVVMRASYYGEIALAGSRLLRSTLATASAPFAHATITVAKNNTWRHAKLAQRQGRKTMTGKKLHAPRRVSARPIRVTLDKTVNLA